MARGGAEAQFWKETKLTRHNPEDTINKSNLEILQDGTTTSTSLQDIADDLPDNSPRYVLLSYPMTLSSGRISVPYVMVYYMPATCNAESRMLFAGAKELLRNTAEVGKILELGDAEDMLEIEERLKGEA